MQNWGSRGSRTLLSLSSKSKLPLPKPLPLQADWLLPNDNPLCSSPRSSCILSRPYHQHQHSCRSFLLRVRGRSTSLIAFFCNVMPATVLKGLVIPSFFVPSSNLDRPLQCDADIAISTGVAVPFPPSCLLPRQAECSLSRCSCCYHVSCKMSLFPTNPDRTTYYFSECLGFP